MAGFSTIDILLLVLIGLGAWRGFRTGLAKQLLSTVGLFLAFILGAAFMDPVGQYVVSHLGISDRTSPIVGFVVLFAAVLGGVTLIGYVFRKALESMKLTSIDNLSGAAIGGIKAAVSASIMLLVTGYSPMPNSGPWLIDEEEREGSVLVGPVETVAPEAWRVLETLTPGIQRTLQEKFNSWHEQ